MEKNKILIVDDEPDIALILKLELEDAGYLTVAARDGVEALDFLGRESFALVLLDIKMPRMDGMEVLSRIKESAWEVAVVMMTAHGCEDIAVEAMKSGALDYIAKPFSCEDMLQKVARAIQYNRTSQENLKLSRQLDEERRKMAAVLQGMADLLLAVDTAGRIITANHTAATVLGIGQEALLGMLLEEALRADSGGGELPSRVVLRTAAPCLDVAYTILAGTTNIPVLSSASPLMNAAGELVGSVEIIRDISRLKALEQEKEDFVGMLSHDLKSPITAVVGSIDLVREGRLGAISADQREYLDAAVESCEEMVEMIDTLLGIHKFEAGKMQLSFRAEDLPALIQRTLGRFQTSAMRGQIKLFATIQEDLPTIAVDRAAFTRILSNLLSNALKFTPEQGEIEVAADEVADFATIRERIPAQNYAREGLPDSGRYVRITVRDTGAGIPAEALGIIFDRFAQAKTRRAGVTRGTGLGLAYCRKAMTAHHGYIWAESQLGKGSLLCMLFPVTV
jgi:PAS domain S-box-containing protein